MELQEAEKMARGVIETNIPGWRFKFDGARRRFGYCDWVKKTISLSRHLVAINDVTEVTKSLLHEVAHALTPFDYHGEKWAAACVALGVVPSRCYNDDGNGRAVKTIRPNLSYKCPSCGQIIERFRRIVKRTACKDCCIKYANGRFDERFIFVAIPAGEI